MRHSPPSAAQSGRVSRSRAMPVGGPHRENWPALQAVRAASSVGGTCRDGSHPDGWGMRRRGPAGRCADRRSAFPCLSGRISREWGPRRDGSFAALRAAVPGSTGRTARRSAFQAVLALVLGLRCAALTLAGWSVIGAGFALPRDAGRRPALQSSSRLFSVCGARHSRWQDGASSARVSRSRAMPVGDRRSWRRAALTVAGGSVIGAGFALPRDAGLETGAPGVSLLAAPPREAGGPGRRPLGGGACRV